VPLESSELAYWFLSKILMERVDFVVCAVQTNDLVFDRNPGCVVESSNFVQKVTSS